MLESRPRRASPSAHRPAPDVGFDGAPLAVEVVELPRGLERAPTIIRNQARYPQAHVGQASGRRSRRGPSRNPRSNPLAREGFATGNGEQGAHAFLHAARADALRPCATRTRLLKSSGTTSATVPSATRSSAFAEIGLLLAGERSTLAELGTQGKHDVEHHADARKALARNAQPGWLGLTMAAARGSSEPADGGR